MKYRQVIHLLDEEYKILQEQLEQMKEEQAKGGAGIVSG